MKGSRNWIIGMVLVSFLATGCYGSFTAFNKLRVWNQRAAHEPWINEVIFLVLNVVPVYAFALLADGLFFNTLEFWTGDNPMSQVRFSMKGDQKAVQEFSQDAGKKRMKLLFYDKGHLEQTLTLHQERGASLFTGSLVTADGARRDFVIEANDRDICLDAFDSSGEETRRIYSLDRFDTKGYGLSGLTPQAKQPVPQN